MYPNGVKSQLDYILLNKKWRNSALNSEPYNIFTSVDSDHGIVTSKVRLSLRMHKNKSRKKINYDWKRLIADIEIKMQYTVEVRNRFQALQFDNETESSDVIYNNIIKANSKAAEKHVPRK